MKRLLNLMKNINERIQVDHIFNLVTVIIFFIILNIVLVFSFLNPLKKEVDDRLVNETQLKVQIGIEEYIKRQNVTLDNISNQIIKDINEYYTNNDSLKEDLHNFQEDSELVDIFRRNINGMSNILIMNSERVFMGNFHSYNMDKNKTKEYFNINMDDFYKNFNSKLLENSFNSIFELLPLKKPTILGFEKGTEKDIIDEFNFKQIKKYIGKNISLIDNFYFISYSYLTDTGDIFNVPDYDVYGNANKNDKIVIIHLFSYSDLDNENVINSVNMLKEELEMVEMRFQNIYYVLSIVGFITCSVCSILFVLILVLFDKKLRSIKH